VLCITLAPPEILARGPRAQEAYENALKSGKTQNRRVPIMFIGQSRAGKTSLLRSLKGIAGILQCDFNFKRVLFLNVCYECNGFIGTLYVMSLCKGHLFRREHHDTNAYPRTEQN
jgi:hypothetical protein